jgi:Syntaxin 6, N-terminal
LYAHWRELLGSTSARDLEELSIHTDEIKAEIRGVERDMRVLDESVNIVERNRHKFHFINDDELVMRKDFLAETRNTIARTKKHLNDPSVMAAVDEHQRGLLMAGASSHGANARSSRYARMDAAMKAENTEFVQAQQQEQREIEREQDQYLDQLIHSGATLELMAEDIYVTLNMHNEMLDEMDTQVQHTDSRIRASVRRVEEVIDKTSNGVGCAVIVFLILALVGRFLSLEP